MSIHFYHRPKAEDLSLDDLTLSGNLTFSTDNSLIQTGGTTYTNVLIGGSTVGNALTTADECVFIGNNAGSSNTTADGNIFIGAGAGTSTTDGYNNTVIGHNAGYTGDMDNGNVVVGNEAGNALTGSANTLVGPAAGHDMLAGANNVYLGYRAGSATTTGQQSVYIGRDAGYSATTTGGSVCIGYQAGYNNTTANRLYIDNSNSATPLIYGEFDNNKARINGTLEVLTATATGTIHTSAQGTYVTSSGVLHLQGTSGFRTDIGDTGGVSVYVTNAHLMMLDNKDLHWGDGDDYSLKFNTTSNQLEGTVAGTCVGLSLEQGVGIIAKVINHDDTSPVAIATVADGYVVTDAWCEVTETFDGDTIVTIGDGNDTDGFLTDAGITQGTAAYYGQIHSARGAYLFSTDELDKIYTGADTVDATITTSTGTQGAMTVYIQISRLK